VEYLKQLDSLRAIAVILVIVSHWVPGTNIINRIPNGEIGVDIFFVLSGFLITSILFENKNRSESASLSKAKIIKNFYFRRSLRIFPIYYILIFILFCLHTSTGTNIQSAFLYFLSYTSNIYFFQTQQWDGMISHLWSLAVEEQFYLIWPWIILFTNKKYLIHVIFIFIFIGIITQLILAGVKMSSLLTFTCFDSFGFGALLSWVMVYNNGKIYKFNLVLSISVLLIFLNWAIGLFFNESILIPRRTIFSILSLCLIVNVILNKDSNSLPFRYIFNNRFLIFLGKISYGLYLYHNLIPGLLNSKFINIYINPYLPSIFYTNYWGQLFLIENTILLILVSWLSYNFIEKKFLHLKRYFVY
jgi:peptidoglycan/LPS O-acetylase OafA/YrhL